jgi:GT2 family glycosyltransferase
MFKHSVIQKAGLMDEDFFLYAEEAEWCSRLKKHGKLCIYGEYHVTHLQGASANDVFGSGGKGYFNLYDQKGLQIMLSNFLRIRKQFGLGWFLIIFFLYMLNIFVFLGCLIIVKLLFPGKSKYSFSQWLSFSKNMTTLIAYVPKIVLRRKFFYKVL